MNTIPAAWYADPAGSGGLRWWDGIAWSEHVRTQEAPPAPAVPAYQPVQQVQAAQVYEPVQQQPFQQEQPMAMISARAMPATPMLLLRIAAAMPAT